MPDRDPAAWPQRHERPRRYPPDYLHETLGHRRMPCGDIAAPEYRCLSCRTPWPCPDVAQRMQHPLTADELAELERRVVTRDHDPHRSGAGIAWDTALELLCAYQALHRDHAKALVRITELRDLLDTTHMEADA